MNFPYLRKLQLVILLSNKIEHLEQPKKLSLKLLFTLGFDVFAVQPNFLARGIAPRLDSPVMNSFLKLLSMVKVLAKNNYQVSKFR